MIDLEGKLICQRSIDDSLSIDPVDVEGTTNYVTASLDLINVRRADNRTCDRVLRLFWSNTRITMIDKFTDLLGLRLSAYVVEL